MCDYCMCKCVNVMSERGIQSIDVCGSKTRTRQTRHIEYLKEPCPSLGLLPIREPDSLDKLGGNANIDRQFHHQT